MLPHFLAWVGENVRTADTKTGRLRVKRLPFGQVNESESERSGAGEDKEGIQITVSMEKMEVWRCQRYENKNRGARRREKMRETGER